MEIHGDGSQGNPYTLEEFNYLLNLNQWTGGWVLLSEYGETCYYDAYGEPNTNIGNDGDDDVDGGDNEGSGEGSGSGCDEGCGCGDEGDGCGCGCGDEGGGDDGSGSDDNLWMKEIQAGSTETQIGGTYVLDVLISWTQGIVTKEGNEYHYIIDQTHGGLVNNQGCAVPESRSLVSVSFIKAAINLTSNSFHVYGYWVGFNTIHVAGTYSYIENGSVVEESISQDISIGGGSGSN